MTTLTFTPDQEQALSHLVDKGTLTADQAAAVRGALWAPGERRSSSSVLIEVAGYVGGGLMLGGATLLLGLAWDRLSQSTLVAILAGYAVALAVAGFAVAGGPHRILALRGASSPIRRRLTSVLFALGAVPSAMAAGVAVGTDDALAAGLAGFAVAAVGYALLPTVFGLLMTVAMSTVAVGGAVTVAHRPDDMLEVYGFVGLGVAWGAAALFGLARPRQLALALAAVITTVGAQLAYDHRPVAYGVTFAVAVLCFLLYWTQRSTTLLVCGVIAATIAVPQAVSHLTRDALSGPTILLLSGAVLVGTSALSLWVRSTRGTATAAIGT
jgi:hypothetical protein